VAATPYALHPATPQGEHRAREYGTPGGAGYGGEAGAAGSLTPRSAFSGGAGGVNIVAYDSRFDALYKQLASMLQRDSPV
jgi:hypothetical protein